MYWFLVLGSGSEDELRDVKKKNSAFFIGYNEYKANDKKAKHTKRNTDCKKKMSRIIIDRTM